MTCSRFLSVVPYLQSSWTDSGLCVIKYNTDTADLLHTWNVKSVHTISSALRCITHFPVLQQICFCCCCFGFFSISKVNWRIKPLYLLKPAKSLAVRTLKTSRLFFLLLAKAIITTSLANTCGPLAGLEGRGYGGNSAYTRARLHCIAWEVANFFRRQDFALKPQR